jgi:hypothetical protein
LRNAQRRFYGLDMARDDVIASMPPDFNLLCRETIEAVRQGAADLVASTYIRENDAIASGIVAEGTPLITFAPLLKGQGFPLPQTLCHVLDLAQSAMETPVEIEFALDFENGESQRPVFHLLQIRPLMVEPVANEIEVDSGIQANAVVFSEDALGHGRRTSVTDLVVINANRFDRATTKEAAAIIERINRSLAQEGRSFILIGPGRWGSQDPWLGIPVSWSQISSARAIVETDFTDLEVEPSQGSHFFHNITCFGIAYLTVHENRGQGRIDWDWFEEQPAMVEELNGVIRHLRLAQPAHVLVDGNTGRGVIIYYHAGLDDA